MKHHLLCRSLAVAAFLLLAAPAWSAGDEPDPSPPLIDRPGLVRVRLELARAFFLKGEDSLARSRARIAWRAATSSGCWRADRRRRW